MDLSFSGAPEQLETLPDDTKDLVGYSHASYNIIQTLKKYGFNSKIDSSTPLVGIGMGYPIDYKFYPHQYKIGYTAWESTKLQDDWYDIMGACDEIWATSSWTARVFKKELGRDDIHVYPHGISHDWVPKVRNVGEVFRFLHIGEPQVRKNGQLVVDAFTELFGDNPKYQLVLKCNGINTTRIYTKSGSIIGSPNSVHKNIIILEGDLTHKQMIDLYHQTHALIYPSAGEGFGFIPLQALATGMPVATTWQWAEYKKYITIRLKSQLSETIHNIIHPGLTYYVDKEEVKKSMIELVENYKYYQQQAFSNAYKIHKEYDWDAVTEPTAKRLKKIFESRGL